MSGSKSTVAVLYTGSITYPEVVITTPPWVTKVFSSTWAWEIIGNTKKTVDTPAMIKIAKAIFLERKFFMTYVLGVIHWNIKLD